MVIKWSVISTQGRLDLIPPPFHHPVKFTINENAASIKTPTARVGSHFRSLITFLAQAHAISEADFSYLIDECKSLEDDLGRTARVNRIMEEYAVYIQEAYFDTGRTVDETYYGEYEVERFEGRRILVLRRYDPDGALRMYVFGDSGLISAT